MEYTFIAAVHRDLDVLKGSLLRSPAIGSPQDVLIMEGYANAGLAYQAGLTQAQTDVVVFVHPDVYLPLVWRASFESSLSRLNAIDPQWGVAGLFGISANGRRAGFVYSTGLDKYIGKPFESPTEVRVLDEFVFAMRRESGLKIDTAIPNGQFQFGAMDLCLQAEAQNRRCYALPCFAVHNSNGWRYMPLTFWKTYLYMRRRWRGRLPILTTYSDITVGCRAMIRSSLKACLGRPNRVTTRVQDPSVLYEQLRSNTFRMMGQ
jgi:hypothetical protein